MKTFRFVLIAAIVGAFAGIVVATLIAPSLLSSQLCGLITDTETSRPCVATVRDATSGLIHIQGYGALAGAILGGVLGGVLASRSKKTASPPTAA